MDMSADKRNGSAVNLVRKKNEYFTKSNRRVCVGYVFCVCEREKTTNGSGNLLVIKVIHKVITRRRNSEVRSARTGEKGEKQKTTVNLIAIRIKKLLQPKERKKENSSRRRKGRAKWPIAIHHFGQPGLQTTLNRCGLICSVHCRSLCFGLIETPKQTPDAHTHAKTQRRKSHKGHKHVLGRAYLITTDSE